MWIEFGNFLVNSDFIKTINSYEIKLREDELDRPKYTISIIFPTDEWSPNSLNEDFFTIEERDKRYEELRNKLCGYPKSNALSMMK